MVCRPIRSIHDTIVSGCLPDNTWQHTSEQIVFRSTGRWCGGGVEVFVLETHRRCLVVGLLLKEALDEMNLKSEPDALSPKEDARYVQKITHGDVRFGCRDTLI